MSNIIKIERGEYCYGIKYWAQWFSHSIIPRYQIFTYYGLDKSSGRYYFKAHKGTAFIHRGFHQLNYGGFVPFVLDTVKGRELIEGGSA